MRRITPIVLSVALLGMAACSNDEDTSSSFCDDRAQLETSVQGLTSIDLSGGVDGLKSQVEDQLTVIKDDLTTLRESAKEELRDEIDAVTDSIDAVEAAVDESETAAQTVASLQTLLPAVGESIQSFVAAAGSIDCS
jgi:vacuolar-type H+-ATPase subunit I/STV1